MSTPLVTLHLEAIPTAMVQVRRWLCWMLVNRGGPKPTKVPIDVYSSEERTKLDVTQEVTPDGPYATLEEAVAYMHRWDLSGIGFILGGGWAGVDHNDCFDPATGTLQNWAWENVRCLASYTEVWSEIRRSALLAPLRGGRR